MKTTIPVSTAKNAVSFIAKNINRRSVLPILGAVRCVANGHLEIESTDLDVTVRASVPCTSEMDGSAILPAASLKQAFGGKSGEIRIETEKHGAKLGGNGLNLSAPTFLAEDWPMLPVQPEGCRHVTIEGEKFFSNLAAVSAAMSEDASRYVLNGVLLERRQNDNLRMVATDGRRLHLATFGEAMTETFVSEFAVIISAGAVAMMLSIPGIKKNPPYVHFSAWTNTAGNKFCSIQCGDYTVISKQIDGNYPNYRQVIPQDHKFCATVDAGGLADIAKQCKSVWTDKFKSSVLLFQDGKLEMTAGSPDNKLVVSTPATYPPAFGGFKIAFDTRYLLEMATAFKAAGNLRLLFIDEMSPVTVQADAWQAVIMPMRLA